MKNLNLLRNNSFSKGLLRLGFICLIVSTVLLMGGRQLLAQEPFYKGKNLFFLCNFNPGGSTDTWSRFQAKHIAKFIPGNPNIVVQNVGGAKGLIGYKTLMEKTKPDGLTVGMIGGAIGTLQALGEVPKGTPPVENALVIAALSDTDVWVGRKEVFPQGYKSLLSSPKKPFVIGALRRDSRYAQDAAIMDLLGLERGKDYKQAYGYNTGNKLHLATARKEVDMFVVGGYGYSGMPSREVKAGNWVPLFHGGYFDENEKSNRFPGFEDLPTWSEIILALSGKEPSGQFGDFLKWRNSGQAAVRMIVVPPKTPDYIVSILTEAWQKMQDDPEYLDAQEKQIGSRAKTLFFGKEARRKVLSVLNKPSTADKVLEELIAK